MVSTYSVGILTLGKYLPALFILRDWVFRFFVCVYLSKYFSKPVHSLYEIHMEYKTRQAFHMGAS